MKNENKQSLILSGDGWSINASPEAEKNKLALLKSASAVKVVNDNDTLEVARECLSGLASFARELEATRKAVKEPVLLLGKKIDAVAQKFGREIEDEVARVKRLIGDYNLEQDRIRREAEAQAAALRAEAERKEREAEAARQKQNALATAKASKLEVQAETKLEQARSFEAQATASKVVGASVVWDFEVTDIDALYHERPDLVELFPKRRNILDALKVLEMKGGPVAIHGIRVFQKSQVRA